MKKNNVIVLYCTIQKKIFFFFFTCEYFMMMFYHTCFNMKEFGLFKKIKKKKQFYEVLNTIENKTLSGRSCSQQSKMT